MAKEDDVAGADETDKDDAVEDTVEWVELEDARDMMLAGIAALTRWERRLQAVAQGLPDPQYDPDTGDALNLPAAVQGLLEALLYDEIRPAVDLLRQATAWVDEPTTWKGPPSFN